MSYAAPLSALAALHLAGNLNPGPNMVLVGQISATQTRTAGVIAGLGLTTGAVIWATAAAIGLGLLAYFAWFQETIRILGGAYLTYLGVTMILGKGKEASAAVKRSTLQAFRAGLFLNLANPYCLMFFSGTFAAVLPPEAPIWVRASAVGIIFFDAVLWYSAIAFLFSLNVIQSSYARFHKWLNRIAGGVLAIFGLRLMSA